MKKILEILLHTKIDFFLVKRLTLLYKTDLITKDELQAKVFIGRITMQEYLKIIS